jgi:hypothetical protein
MRELRGEGAMKNGGRERRLARKGLPNKGRISRNPKD